MRADRSPAVPAIVRPARASAITAALLGFVAGFVDTTGFVVFAGIFVAHVTGNFVLLGAVAASEGNDDVWRKVSVLPLFVFGVALGWWLARRSGSKAAIHLAWSECACLVLCAALALATPSRGETDGYAIHLAIGLAVFAMGLQSVLSRRLALPMTNVMTGNVTQLTIDLLDARAHGESMRRRGAPGIFLVISFALGAAAAGLTVPILGMFAMAIPSVALAVLASCLVIDRPVGETDAHSPSIST